MLTQDLNNSSALTEGVLVPLEIPTCVLEHGSKFVALKLVGGEDPGAGRVREEDLVHVLANQAHTRLLTTLRNRQLLPTRHDDGFASGVSFLDLTETLLFVLRNNREDLVDGPSFFSEEFSRVV